MRLLIGLSLGHAGATAATFETEQAPSVEGEALVVFREGTDLAMARKKAGGQDATVKKAFRRNMKNRRQLCVHLRSEGKSTAELIASLEADPSVEFAEPNYLRRFDTVTPPANDPYFDLQWALQNTGQVVNGTTGTAGADIGWVSARPLLRPSSEEIVIAIVDSGIDPYHPDLIDHLWTNPGEIPGNQIDDDANGYVDDVHGYRFTGDGDNNIGDSGEHGTHVAGTIAAVANNGIGVAGVVPGVKLMILRVSDNGQDFSASGEIEAFEYLTMMKQRGVNVVAINGSYGGGGYSRAERNAIDDAGDEGIVFCAAAGNDSADNDAVTYYPAGYRRSNMIVVAATDQDDGLSSFSNYGLTTVDLAAPGRNIYSTRPSWSVATNASVQVGAASYVAAGIRYAGHTEGMTQSVHHCGLGYPEDFPPEVAGNIALIERGTLFFFEKVTNAMEAGAVAVIVYNNVEDAIDYWHLMQPSPWIPAVGISKADGEALTAALPLSATVVNSPNPSQWYKYMFGTSMATPHVTSAVAFAARNTPGDNSAQRVARVLAGVSSAPELAGKTVTGGRLDLHRLVDATKNGLPDWWEVDHFLASPVDPSADVDGDLNDHLTEFLAGTDPLDPASRFTITSAQYESGSPFQVTLPSISGRIYQLEQSTTLTAESWSSVGDPVFGSGSPVMIEVPASGPKQFYRVSVELSP